MPESHPNCANSRGNELAEYAESVIGEPFRPWQARVAERLLEVDADGVWCWAPAPNLLLVPRQVGKSTLLRAMAMWFADQGLTVLTTSNKLRSIHQLQRPARMWARNRPDVTVYRAQDQPEIEWPSGGRWVGQADTEDLGRSWTVDVALVDEVQDVSRDAVVASLFPAMSAVQNPFVLMVGTAARGESALLTQYRETAIRGADGAGALMEWSAPPGSDYTDERVWRESTPWWDPVRVRYLRTQVAMVKDSVSESEFRSEYLCQPVAGGREPWINLHAWDACRAELERPARPAVAAVEDEHGRSAAVALVWPLPDGRLALWADSVPTLEDAWRAAAGATVTLCGATLYASAPARAVRAQGAGIRETGTALPELRRVAHDRRLAWTGSTLSDQVRTVNVRDNSAGTLTVMNRPASAVLRAAAWAVQHQVIRGAAVAQVF